jgi:hypothetical protein
MAGENQGVMALADTGIARSSELDGIRGSAALMAVLHHVDVLPLQPQVAWPSSPRLRGLTNESLAVAAFLVLSSDSLLSRFWRKRQPRSVVRSALNRCPRLALPVLLSCVLVWIVLRVGLDAHHAPGQVLGSMSLSTVNGEAAILAELFRYAAWGVFADLLSVKFLQFLWTMRTEMAASFAELLLLFSDSEVRWPTWSTATPSVVAWLAGVVLSCLLAGVLTCRMRADGGPRSLERQRHKKPRELAVASSLGFAGWILRANNLSARPSIAAASVLKLGIDLSQTFAAAVRRRISHRLRENSFSLYFTHYVVLIVVTNSLVVIAHAHAVQSEQVAAAIDFFSVALALGLAALIHPLKMLSMHKRARCWHFVQDRSSGRVRRLPSRKTEEASNAEICEPSTRASP